MSRVERRYKETSKEHFSREILSLHTTLGKTNYEETRLLFNNNVLTEKLTDGSLHTIIQIY